MCKRRKGLRDEVSAHGLDVASVDHPRHDPHGLQRGKRTLPVNARVLHHHDFGRDLDGPLGEFAAVAFECAERPNRVRRQSWV
jgi:hypothetical protein